MKRITMLLLLVLTACSSAAPASGLDMPVMPQVWIDQPLSHTTLAAAAVDVQGHAYHPDGVTAFVLLVDGEDVATQQLDQPATLAQSHFTWTANRAGSYELILKARSRTGDWSSSPPVQIGLGGASVAQAPDKATSTLVPTLPAPDATATLPQAAATVASTAVPPPPSTRVTSPPPTRVPPTAVPPTRVPQPPATAVPQAPPTAVQPLPATAVPPTAVPPPADTAVPPTAVPPPADTAVPPTNAPVPVAELSASPSSVQPGECATLSWNTVDATSATLDGAEVSLNGRTRVCPKETTTYTLIARNGAESAGTQATVEVFIQSPTIDTPSTSNDTVYNIAPCTPTTVTFSVSVSGMSDGTVELFFGVGGKQSSVGMRNNGRSWIATVRSTMLPGFGTVDYYAVATASNGTRAQSPTRSDLQYISCGKN